MNWKKVTAMLMIYLIVFMTVITSLAFAQISQITVRGQSGIQNFVQSNDQVDVTVNVDIPGDPYINNSQVKLNNIVFSSCSAGVSGTNCHVNFPTTGTTQFTLAQTPFSIFLFADDGSQFASAPAGVTLDNRGPIISNFVITPDRSLDNTVTLSYSITDVASFGAPLNVCTKPDHVDVLVDNSVATTHTITSPSCSAVVSKPFIAPFTSGVKQICLIGYDKFNQPSSPTCANLEIVPLPQINPATFSILDGLGVPMNVVPPYESPVRIQTHIVSDSFAQASVLADLSSLGASTSVTGPCVLVEPLAYKCTFDSSIKINQSGTYNIALSYTDTNGTSITESKSASILVDNIGPVITSLTSNTSYLKPLGNTISATVSEAGSGLDAADMKLHVGSASPISAQYCLSGYTCVWNNINAGTGDLVEVSIRPDSKDRFGNPAVLFTRTFQIDRNPPQIRDVKITNIGGQNPAIPGFPRLGETIEIEVTVTDDIQAASMQIPVSAVNTQVGVAVGSCSLVGGDVFKCTVSFPITKPGYITTQLPIKVFDAAGNIASVTRDFAVYSTNSIANPDFWQSSVDCSPSRIDRSVTTLINQLEFCHVRLISNNNAQVVSQNLQGCADAQNSSTSTLLLRKDLLNIPSQDPVIRLLFKTAEFKINSIELECSLEIRSLVAGSITEQLEIEKVPISIPLYNQPLGKLDKNVQAKIDDAKDSVDNFLWDIIGILRLIFKYAEIICKTYYSLVRVINFGYGVYKIIEGGENAVKLAFPPAGPPLEAQRKGYAYSLEYGRVDVIGIGKYADKFCKWINCQHVDSGEKDGFFEQTGGGGGIASDFVGKIGGNFLQTYTGKNPQEYMNVKDSIVLSLLGVCIPGIIYNLDKYRQILCMYADCLQNNPKTGIPISACEQQKEYATCKYFVGEVFKIVPFTALFDYYMDAIRNALSDPLGIVGIVFGAICAPTIEAPLGFPYDFCVGVEIANQLGYIIKDVTAIIDGDYFKLQEDFCEKLNKDEKK